MENLANQITKDNNDQIKKNLLSASVVKKNYRVDTEKILYEELFPKFGERYINYRKKYENYLKDNEHKFTPDFRIRS